MASRMGSVPKTVNELELECRLHAVEDNLVQRCNKFENLKNIEKIEVSAKTLAVQATPFFVSTNG